MAFKQRTLTSREQFRLKVLLQGRYFVAFLLVVTGVVGIVINATTGNAWLIGLFVLVHFIQTILIVLYRGIAVQIFITMPTLYFISILVSAYFLESPLLVSLLLALYIFILVIIQQRVIAQVWSALLIVGFGIIVLLNPYAGGFSFTDQALLILAGFGFLAFSYMLAEILHIVELEYGESSDKLEESEARYDVLLNSIGDGMIIVDKKGFIQFVNRRALDLIVAPRKQILGQPVSAAILMQNQNGAPIRHTDHPVTDVLRTGERLVSNMTSKQMYMIVRSDNTTFPVSLSVSAIQLLGGVDGAVVLFNDSSDLEEMEKAKSEFVSLASHQLRTPLNVVSWYSEKLISQKKGPLNDRQKDYVKEIHTNNSRMISLVSDLLNVSRVDLGRRKRKHHEVDFTKLIHDLLKEVEPLGKEKNIKTSVTLPKENMVFHDSDDSMLTVIVQNLLSNSIKYTPKNGSVSLQINEVSADDVIDQERRLTASRNGIVMAVADTGVGIPVAQQDQIFSRLFRADNVQRMDVEGTGLGLYVTHSFARILDGDVWFESSEGEGTTFYVYLPY